MIAYNKASVLGYQESGVVVAPNSSITPTIPKTTARATA
jgi:hypothetical protein